MIACEVGAFAVLSTWFPRTPLTTTTTPFPLQRHPAIPVAQRDVVKLERRQAVLMDEIKTLQSQLLQARDEVSTRISPGTARVVDASGGGGSGWGMCVCALTGGLADGQTWTVRDNRDVQPPSPPPSLPVLLVLTNPTCALPCTLCNCSGRETELLERILELEKRVEAEKAKMREAEDRHRRYRKWTQVRSRGKGPTSVCVCGGGG